MRVGIRLRRDENGKSAKKRVKVIGIEMLDPNGPFLDYAQLVPFSLDWPTNYYCRCLVQGCKIGEPCLKDRKLPKYREFSTSKVEYNCLGPQMVKGQSKKPADKQATILGLGRYIAFFGRTRVSHLSVLSWPSSGLLASTPADKSNSLWPSFPQPPA